MKVIKSILTYVIYFILLLIVSFNVYNYVSINILHDDLPKINGYAILEVVSGSMEPTIKVGDLIIIDTKDKELHEKDIITFYDVNGAFVTHRIIKIDGKDIYTKGDNNNTEDEEPILKSDVAGKYVTKISGLGKLMTAFKTPFVMLMILVIGILICYLVSTDKNGKPIITEEEKEYEEFLEYKKKKQDDKLSSIEEVNKKNENIKTEIVTEKKDNKEEKSGTIKKTATKKKNNYNNQKKNKNYNKNNYTSRKVKTTKKVNNKSK